MAKCYQGLYVITLFGPLATKLFVKTINVIDIKMTGPD